MVKEKAINLILFFIFAFAPILLNSVVNNSLDNSTKKILFIQEKIPILYPGLTKKNPEISIINDSRPYSSLNLDSKIKNGDIMYIFKNEGIAIFADPKTEEILGETEIK